MLEYSTAEELMALTRYERIAVYLFRTLTRDYVASTLPEELHFKTDDVVAAMNAAVNDGVIARVQKNVPDVKYTFDARRHMPAEIEQLGPITWLATGKGKYKFKRTKRRNLMPFPNAEYPEPAIEIIPDQTPRFITSMLGRDEQATFTRVRNAGLISAVLGFQAWPIQGHHRTTVNFGQIEVDEVQAGVDKNQGTIVPISGKGGADMLSWSQARALNTYGAEKSQVADVAVRSIGLWRDKQDTVWIVEFSPHLEIDDIHIIGLRRFKFE